MNRITLAGRYRIREHNHHSGCPDLVPADDLSSGLTVDLQWIPPNHSNDPLQMARIRHRVQLIHGINHPHIARLHALEFEPQQRRHFVVWEAIHPLSLQEYRLSRPEQRLPCAEALQLCRMVATALDNMHRSLLHRHVRPERIFMDRNTVKLGCIPVVPADLEPRRNQPLDQREQAYSAPELHTEAESPASDRWALAVLFYELVSGTLPNNNTTPPGLNRASQRLLQRALAKNPQERFPTAEAFITALSDTLATRRQRKRHWVILALLLTLSALPWSGMESIKRAVLFSTATPLTKPHNQEPLLLTPDLKKSLLLQIESQPPGATVILDGKRLGSTPFTVGRVAPGAYHLWLEKEGHKTVELEMDLTQDTIVSLNLEDGTENGPAEERKDGPEDHEGDLPLRLSPLPEARGNDDPSTKLKDTLTLAAAPHLWQDPQSGLRFVHLPGGCFNMGSSQGDRDETPVHSVCLGEFWLGQHEVTQAAWNKVMHGESNPAHFRNSERLPVDSLSWEQAQHFVARLNAQSSYRFRLPSEAEWEYACRGGAQTPFQFGNTIHAGRANFNGERQIGQEVKGHYVGTPLPVGSFAANRFGLYDMHGNLYEWVADAYQADYYQRTPSDNPVATAGEGQNPLRVLRGGAWYSTPLALRCAARHKDDPLQNNHGYGFRLLREP
ncbi:MAG: SUMF1/EgtB/PvdO family nonheme iron enzyme [Magnetococcales bacterium]|nr:SUMF1/EgtB/PvdO family nonheme iron enzyme [Magnetococcales bacterium]MBF0113766.1 SUMF1/EgtB/PvdO family nonheme iron enzyme [Magnetococcales bacterium]